MKRNKYVSMPDNDLAGPLVLAGSGEFLPVMDAVDREVLRAVQGSGKRIAIVPTASGLENPGWWIDLGVRHFQALGAQPYGVRAYTREDADDAEFVHAVEAANFIYFSGGKPRHVVDALRGSKLWAATLCRHKQGAALAGCSAGIMMLGGCTYDPGALRVGASLTLIPALGLFPNWLIIPHFSNDWMFAAYSREEFRKLIPPGLTTLGIDENTALLRSNGIWSVWGTGGVIVWVEDGQTMRYHSGDSGITLPCAEP